MKRSRLVLVPLLRAASSMPQGSYRGRARLGPLGNPAVGGYGPDVAQMIGEEVFVGGALSESSFGVLDGQQAAVEVFEGSHIIVAVATAEDGVMGNKKSGY
ncbi:hypothetical protein WBJ53_24095 [Spirosoma sp. SC4-14]|uniref:hypothetical protein n=1 Tax=Spirosoma sp. SC4-14 TaxID=3128900 RepID=UPI0030CA746D